MLGWKRGVKTQHVERFFLYLDRRKDSRSPISRRPSLRQVGRLEASLSSICRVKSASTRSLVALERRAPVFIRSMPPYPCLKIKSPVSRPSSSARLIQMEHSSSLRNGPSVQTAAGADGSIRFPSTNTTAPLAMICAFQFEREITRLYVYCLLLSGEIANFDFSSVVKDSGVASWLMLFPFAIISSMSCVFSFSSSNFLSSVWMVVEEPK